MTTIFHLRFRRGLRWRLLRLLAPGLSGLLLLTAHPAPGAALSPSHHASLAAAHALIEQEQWKKAQQALDELRQSVGELKYPRALVLQAEGWLHTGSGEPIRAIEALRGALALDALPQRAAQDTRYLLAQLLLEQGDAAAAAAVMDDWLAASPSPAPEGLYLAGTALALAGDEARAATYLDRAVAGVDELPEDWGRRLLALQLEAGDDEQARALLRRLIAAHADEKTYWLQLADIEARLDGEAAALSVLETARQRGLLRQPAELLDLAGRWLRLGVPERAAWLLQDVIDDGRLAASPANLDLLADAWWGAGAPARARAAVERALAAAPETGSDLDRQAPGAPTATQTAAVQRQLRLAQLAAELEDWQGVLAATAAALDGADPAASGRAHLLAGIARYYRDEREQARRHFELAAEADGSRADAQRWLASLRTEGPGRSP
jgi:hypothetical protein